MKLIGNDIIIYKDGTAIALSKNGTITLDAELMPIADPSDGEVTAYVIKRLTWKITTTSMVETVKGIITETGSIVNVKFGIRGDQGETRGGGSAIVTKTAVDGAVGNLATGRFEFVGTGRLDRDIYDIFWGTVASQYVATKTSQKIRILRDR